MIYIYSVILVLFLLTIRIIRTRKKEINHQLKRFKGHFETHNRIKNRLRYQSSERFILDPSINITITSWDREQELREKADIHRARLNKHGKSKMNGTMIYIDNEDNVYRTNEEGQKEYL